MSWPCVLPHRFEPNRPRRTVEGLLVCHGCLSRLEQALAEIPAQWHGLSSRLTSAGAAGSKVSGSPDAQLSLNPVVVALREDVLWKLVCWVRLVAEERRLVEPSSNDVGVLAGWLLVHLRWCCAQRWIDDYVNELLGYESEAFGRWVPGLRGRMISALYPSGRRHVVVGGCVEPGCVGTLTATVAQIDDVLPSSVDCSEDGGHTWSSSQWPALGRRLHGPAGYERRAAAAFLDLIAAS